MHWCGLAMNCFDLVYALSYIQPDKSPLTLNKCKGDISKCLLVREYRDDCLSQKKSSSYNTFILKYFNNYEVRLKRFKPN